MGFNAYKKLLLAFADITGSIILDYSASEVAALTLDSSCLWYKFNEGVSGSFTYNRT